MSNVCNLNIYIYIHIYLTFKSLWWQLYACRVSYAPELFLLLAGKQNIHLLTFIFNGSLHQVAINMSIIYSSVYWWDKPQCKPAFQYNLWPTSQARLGLIGSLVPYVTYNLCSACTAGREGQRSPWAKVAMGTTSGCSALLFAALTHLKAELYRISLCHSCILLLYFLTLLCSFSSLCFLSTHTHTDAYMQWHLDTGMHADTYMSLHSHKHTRRHPHPYTHGIHT